MSRIGKNPIAIPSGVNVSMQGSVIEAKGPRGANRIDHRNHVAIKQADGQIHVERHSDAPQDRAYHGLYQRLVTNLITGVHEGFSKDLELVGVGYRAQLQGKTLMLNLGFSHDVKIEPIEGIEFKVEPPGAFSVTGYDKQKVGQVAADIRKLRPPEPYKGKGVRYKGELVRRKVGKTGAK